VKQPLNLRSRSRFGLSFECSNAEPTCQESTFKTTADSSIRSLASLRHNRRHSAHAGNVSRTGWCAEDRHNIFLVNMLFFGLTGRRHAAMSCRQTQRLVLIGVKPSPWISAGVQGVQMVVGCHYVKHMVWFPDSAMSADSLPSRMTSRQGGYDLSYDRTLLHCTMINS